MAKTPRVLRARNRHSSEDGCAPESPASSAMLLGPDVSKSAIPSLVAACIACAAIMPGQMYSIGLDMVLLLWFCSHGPVHLSWRASREGQIGDFGEAQRVADAQERPRRQTAPVSFIMLACRRSVGPICDRD